MGADAGLKMLLGSGGVGREEEGFDRQCNDTGRIRSNVYHAEAESARRATVTFGDLPWAVVRSLARDLT